MASDSERDQRSDEDDTERKRRRRGSDDDDEEEDVESRRDATWAPRRSKSKHVPRPRRNPGGHFIRRPVAVPNSSESSSTLWPRGLLADPVVESKSSSIVKAETEIKRESNNDPLYLVYDDSSAKDLDAQYPELNGHFMKQVNKWVAAHDGHVAQADVFTSPGTSDSQRPLRCIPFSEVYNTLTERARYSNAPGSYLKNPVHLNLPLRSVFVAFAFYDADKDDIKADRPSLEVIQEFPSTLATRYNIESSATMFIVRLVVLVSGKNLFIPRHVFRRLYPLMPDEVVSVQLEDQFMFNADRLTLWNHSYVYFFAVDRPECECNEWPFRGLISSNFTYDGLFDNQFLAPAAALDHILTLGLAAPQQSKRSRDSSEPTHTHSTMWNHFLTKGLYDPRLFLHVQSWLMDPEVAQQRRDRLRNMWLGADRRPFFDPVADRGAPIMLPDDEFYSKPQ